MLHSCMRFLLLKNTTLIFINKKSLLNKNSWYKLIQICRMCSKTDSTELLSIRQVETNFAKMMGVNKRFMIGETKKDYLLKFLPKNVEELEPRSMQDSYTKILIPLSTNIPIRNKYINFLGTVRIGRLLEDMDLFAAWIVLKHIKNPRQKPDIPIPYVLVTGLVDKINFTYVKPQIDQDILLSGHVSWVGRSSAEVVVWLQQMQHGSWRKITMALFVMVAKNALLTGPALLNPIKPANEREKEILTGGNERKEKRLLLRKQSLIKVIPTLEEQMLIHKVFMSTLKYDDVALNILKLPDNSEWMQNCKLVNNVITHPENRNFHHKVFGGFIMRNAFELAFNLVYLYCKEIPNLKHVSDVVFHKPIEISSLIRMTAYVVYTVDDLVQISVYVESSETHSEKLFTTNELHFTFEITTPPKTVIPKTYHEAMLYINGKRHLNEVIGSVSVTDPRRPTLEKK